MGLKTVSFEPDEPFGDDDNNFDNLGMTFSTIFKDDLLLINAIDDPKYTNKLHAKLFNKRASDISHRKQT